MTFHCVLAGVGGQGIVLASKLIAQAAMNRGLFVRTAETIGMAQRGGCVVSHVRVGEDVFSPMVPKGGADLILGFEPAEAVRCLPYLKPGGAVVASTRAVTPVTASLSGSAYNGARMLTYLRRLPLKLAEVDGGAVCAECGTARTLNVALLGAACTSGALPFDRSELETALRTRVAPRFAEMNLRALHAGAQAVRLIGNAERECLR